VSSARLLSTRWRARLLGSAREVCTRPRAQLLGACSLRAQRSRAHDLRTCSRIGRARLLSTARSASARVLAKRPSSAAHF